MKYNHRKIEAKWQKAWEKDKLYVTPDEKKGAENFYTLVEFPYPSGNLHVGHWYAFSVPDIFARMKRMQGYNVLFPIGFDAFGLPAENAAIKRGINPRKWTYDNIDYMRRQLRTMGASFDWSREVMTCDPEYYKWTQWIFLQFFKNGLAYQAETNVNWCPSCKTVLANEQVVGGVCERCERLVEQRKMKQWQLRITDYAEELLSGLEKLDWPEEIKESQRNWIGKSNGAEIEFPVVIPAKALLSGAKAGIQTGSRIKSGMTNYGTVKVFTTRPDTIFGATYIVLAPEHKLISKIKNQISNIKEVEDYIKKAQKKTELQRAALEKEKTGVELKGIKAINPATKEEIPVWVADYVLPSYGTGAIMAVPAHDERDFEFAKKYNLHVRYVIAPFFETKEGPDAIRQEKPLVKRQIIYVIVKHWSEDKYLCLDWERFGWHTGIIGGIEDGEHYLKAAEREIKEETGYKNLKLVKEYPTEIHNIFFARHKDENRYAVGKGLYFELIDGERGTIPSEHSVNHKCVWVEKEKMTVFLNLKPFVLLWDFIRKNESFTDYGILINSGKFTGMKSEEAIPKMAEEFGKLTVQYKLRDWVISRQRYWGVPIPVVHCKDCGVQPVKEKDLPVLLPEIKDYKPRGDGKSPLAKIEKWVEVKCPKCGGMAKRETDTMDTFIDSSWYFLRYTDPKNKKEFASQNKMKKWMPVDRYSGGAEHTTMHLLYSRFWIKAMHDLGLLEWDEPYVVRMNRGLILGPDGQKMSKSRGNVVDPDDYVKELGTDTVRMYLAFIGPYNEVGAYPWNPKGIMGIRRFLEKVWRLFQEKSKIKNQKSTAAADKIQNDGIQRFLHKTIKKVTEDIEAFKFNTAISALMILVNEFSNKQTAVSSEQLEIFFKLLAPLAPHLAEELWHQLDHKKSIHLEKWPKYDKNLVKEELINLPVQINGKLRSTFRLAADASEEEAKELASKDKIVVKHLAGKTIKKVIYVKGKIINFVV